MKKLLFFISGLVLAYSASADNETKQNNNTADKVANIADRSSQIIGNSLLVVNDFIFPDSVKQEEKVDSIPTKKGYGPLLELASKGNKVFIVAKDEGVLAHASKNMNYWHYWNVVDKKEEADFTMEIKFRYGNMGRSFCYALFFDKDGKEVYKTREVDNFANADLNFKRSAVNNLLDNVVKPIFEL